MVSEIKICMGSACFAKGNQEKLDFIKEYLKENNLEAEVVITGTLCEDKCADGPRIIFDGKECVNCTHEKIIEMLKG